MIETSYQTINIFSIAYIQWLYQSYKTPDRPLATCGSESTSSSARELKIYSNNKHGCQNKFAHHISRVVEIGWGLQTSQHDNISNSNIAMYPDTYELLHIEIPHQHDRSCFPTGYGRSGGRSEMHWRSPIQDELALLDSHTRRKLSAPEIYSSGVEMPEYWVAARLSVQVHRRFFVHKNPSNVCFREVATGFPAYT